MISLSWEEKIIEAPSAVSIENGADYMAYAVNCHETADEYICRVIGECVEKAVELLPLNISDDSMYLLFEWDVEQSVLSIVVTDESKSKDAARMVRSCFPALNEQHSCLKQQSVDEWQLKISACQESIRYWVRDYLTTCGGFMHFSLIAVFCSKSRAKTALL